MKKYFIQTYNHLPPMKWLGDEIKAFLPTLRKMIKTAPEGITVTQKHIQESINITSIDTETFEKWEKVFNHNPKWSWDGFRVLQNPTKP